MSPRGAATERIGGPGLLGCRDCCSMKHGGDGSACHRKRVAELRERGLVVPGPRFGPPGRPERSGEIIPLAV